jgi:hypothetical protein
MRLYEPAKLMPAAARTPFLGFPVDHPSVATQKFANYAQFVAYLDQ